MNIMSTLFSALVATMTITSGQTYEDCGTFSSIVGGSDISMQVERDSENSMVRLTFNGPTDKWYGFVIGSGTMSGYAITVGQDSAGTLEERQITFGDVADILTESAASSYDSGLGSVTLVRGYAGADADYFDFTDLMECTVTSIDMAVAIGSDFTMGNHGPNNRNPDLTFTSQCTCATADPTMSPVDDVDAGTPAPTMSPVDNVDADTPAPTMSPVDTDTDDYVICGSSELIDNVLLTVYRDAANQKVRVVTSGDASLWFAYGFGSAEMNGAYAVAVQTTDSALETALYTLNKGGNTDITDSVTAESEVTSDGTTAVSTLTMSYAALGFDFTNFLTCVDDSIDIIAGLGMSSAFGYHGSTTANRVGGGSLTRPATCTCSDSPTTTAAANNIFNGFYVMIAVFFGYLLM